MTLRLHQLNDVCRHCMCMMLSTVSLKTITSVIHEDKKGSNISLHDGARRVGAECNRKLRRPVSGVGTSMGRLLGGQRLLSVTSPNRGC